MILVLKMKVQPQSSKANRTGVSQTGFSKKVLEQVREGLRIPIREKRRFVLGRFVGWRTVKKCNVLLAGYIPCSSSFSAVIGY